MANSSRLRPNFLES